MKKTRVLGQAIHYFGLRWLAWRLAYSAQRRLGVLRRRMPEGEWDAFPLADLLHDRSLAVPECYDSYRRASGPHFFFGASARTSYHPYFSRWDDAGATALAQADEIIRGTHRYFSHVPVTIGRPPDWHTNPLTGQRLPADLHWSQIGDFEHGDIKIIWEPSRFGSVYPLARAYWRTGDNCYAECFWQLVEDWAAHNRPNFGPNWKCGQETSLRVMALSFGLYAFLDAAATTPARVARLAQIMAASGQRIAANRGYAVRQRNNHGISEGTGLWTIGLLFPELREAQNWREAGRSILEQQARELIYSDGAFSQHSVNYHRLMLHDYLWSLQLGRLNNQPLSEEVYARVAQAGEFLYQLQDETGRLPRYGQNDGALILPLNNCDYQDFRPVIQAVHYLTTQSRCYSPGPWDEDLLWLFGPSALAGPLSAPERLNLWAPVGGYYTLRAKEGFAFVRCATFRDRPGQADNLHVDIWWRGQNIALDPGTYSYNAPAPWDNPLAGTSYHNMITVDGQDQMERVGRFLWLPWLRGQVRHSRGSAGGGLVYWEGEHDGYKRLSPPVTHRRGIIRLGDEGWLILDQIESHARHTYRLHWLLPDVPYYWDQENGKLVLRTPAGPYYVSVHTAVESKSATLVRADTASPRGWQAPYYSHREPALSLALETQAATAIYCTFFSPESSEIVWTGATLRVSTARWRATVTLSPSAGGRLPLATGLSVSGLWEDSLEVT